MEILKILEESADSLISEDLDFFETELATGDGYEETYIEECKEKIGRIRKWMAGEIASLDEVEVSEGEQTETPSEKSEQEKKTKKNKSKKNSPKGIVVGLDQVAPEGAGPVMPKLSPIQQIQSDMKTIRGRSDYKSAFKKYAKDSQIIDADFLDKNFSLFDTWEMDAIVSVKQMGEEFLEKYFGAIDHDKIARYQLFSESFFMKHFAQMDASIVLEHGKNEWRKKENRSKQLDVFLRLKGVKN